jgi:hypothetical protein
MRKLADIVKILGNKESDLGLQKFIKTLAGTGEIVVLLCGNVKEFPPKTGEKWCHESVNDGTNGAL